MSIHEITEVVAHGEFVGLKVKGLDKDLIVPEAHLWAILARDELRGVALNRGIPKMRVELGKPPGDVPEGVKFIVRFHHPAVRAKTMKLDLDNILPVAGT